LLFYLNKLPLKPNNVKLFKKTRHKIFHETINIIDELII